MEHPAGNESLRHSLEQCAADLKVVTSSEIHAIREQSPTRINVTSGNMPEMPPLRGWSSIRYARRWAFAELGAVAANRQPLVSTDLRESPTAGYAILNLKFGLTYRKLSASLAIDNLLDRFYYEHLSYYRDPFAAGVKLPEPGRNLFAQLRYSF